MLPGHQRKRHALHLRNPETDRLAAELARQTGETKTEAVTNALRDCRELEEIAELCASLPILDARTAAEILGYDENGLA